MPALGWRVWHLDSDGGLYSTGKGCLLWQPGVNTAHCLRTSKHQIPHQDCQCGLYAFHQQIFANARARQTGGKENYIVGAVAARGTIQVHHHGFRAPESVILALIHPGGIIHGQHANLAAKRYGVPLIEDFRGVTEWLNALALTIPQGQRPLAPSRLRRFSLPLKTIRRISKAISSS